MSAPREIKELVAKFERNLKAYKSTSYNEEQVKQEFINPFFESLGWDVSNKAGAAPQYRDVIFEDSIKVGKGTKAPDYCFTLAGRKMFFLEAKKPSVNIKDDKSPAYQVRRYAWSAKLSLSILTDFEELAIYETKTRPLEKEKASTGRVAFYKFTDYIEKWDEIANVFSKEAVLQGSFDKFIEEDLGKKGTSEVDDEFLKEIEDWRLNLAKNIAKHNPELSVNGLNYAVQLIINRIIFFRMAEDRGIEPYEQLYTICDRDNIYEEFGKLCIKADHKYNSGLFHFKEEKGVSDEPDEYTLKLIIDNNVLKNIIKDLYYPRSPYEFSVLSPEILGNIYEKFLGKIIRFTTSHQVKIEEKPEIQKMGGVFYTPQKIVDYIVKNTLAKLLKKKTPNQVSKIKVIDPACGSGSFLMGVYQYLIDWHLNYYLNLKQPPNNVIYKRKDQEYNLTIHEKKRILLNNIYGVDVDYLAVEVTKLSLFLKVLEDENSDVLEAQQKLFQERALPNLGDNIKCGNTLIETDISDEKYEDYKNGDNLKNPFEWENEFPEVFNKGGFDIVVGNPPYVRHELIKEMKPYLKEHYKLFYGTADKYVYFFEKGIDILKEEGILAYICSNKFTRAKYGKNLRKFLLNNTIIKHNDYTGDKIFKRATVDSCISIIKKIKSKNNIIKFNDKFTVDQNRFDDGPWSIEPPEILDLKNKIMNKGTLLKNINDIYINRGITTGLNKVFIIDEKTKKRLISEDIKNQNIIKQLVKGKDIKKWNINYKNEYLIFTRRGIEINNYPSIKEYLLQFKKELTPKNKARKIGRKPGKYKWYEIQDTTSYYTEFEKDKIIWAEIASQPSFVVDTNNYYFPNSAYMLTMTNTELSIYYLTCLLNSNLSFWLFGKISSVLGKKGLRFTNQYVSQLPIYKASKKEQKPFINLAVKLMQLNNDLTIVKTPYEKKTLKQTILFNENKINQLVYELYDLTDDEIKIIEDSLK